MNINELDKKYLFTDLEKDILVFLKNSCLENKVYSIRDVAAQCYTSPASIIKLAKKLNLSGYSELVDKIQEQSTLSVPEDFLTTLAISEAYEIIQTKKEKFQKLIDKYRYKKILIVSNGFSDYVAQYIHDALALRGFTVFKSFHFELVREKYHDETLIIAISESGETTTLQTLLSNAFHNQIEIITFTGNTTSTLSELSTLDLSIDVFKGLSIHSQTEPHFFFGIALIIFESLINK